KSGILTRISITYSFFLMNRIFVNMDDNIIEHYSNHSAFLIEITEVMINHFQITLMEL
uniref:GRHL1/CP2 C-terminal domain-containing protein n=1 Tax=Sinocyclocheilus rhinocerous TaxID=307959 RepID=A0A673M0N3_9TELE